ncbi:M15 family metallopeptidase [Nocardioides sp.]|uniref:M15 family metallopeptidase n=1 Tax=Nocardioides sp. TaxID=35761 RepID=UPI003515C151
MSQGRLRSGIPRARLVPAALVTAVVVAACAAPRASDDAGSADGSGSGATPAGGPTTPAPDSPTDTTTGSPTDTGLDPALAMPAPGPRTEPLASADVLVQAATPLGADVQARLAALTGVTASLPLSVAQVSVESQVYTVAAVDPAEYRRFTAARSAELDEQWARVAAGEVAADTPLRAKDLVDDAGFLPLTIGDTTRRLHIGAWAPQVPGIDLVVNERVGEALGMPADNAVLLSTGTTAPQVVRRPVVRTVGDRASVQNLDVVARLGLDPGAVQTAVLVGAFSDAVGTFTYTPIGGGRVAPDPAWVREHIRTEVVPILGSVTCNKDLFPQLRAALAEVVSRGLADEINPDEYAGCYYPRFIAGSSTLSNHSFGLALDLNVPGNQRGTVGEMDRDVVDIFKYWGFAWGGDWNYTDPMHFELARIVRPG